MPLYICYSGPMATSSAPSPVSTGTSTKTLLQVAAPATRQLRLVEWGISFDGFQAAEPVRVELVETDAAATVTAHTASGVQPYGDPNAPASEVVLGSQATGYNASSEGSISSTRHAGLALISPTSQFHYLWPLGREFVVAPGWYLRVRVTAAESVGAYAYVVWEE